jgi:hypothetical protein
MRMPSGSSVERALSCTGSVTLPSFDNVNEFAEAGTVLHEYIDNALEYGVEVALAKVPPEHTDAALAIKIAGIEKLPGHEGELALAYDLLADTTRVVGQRIGRDYGPRLKPSEIFLTIDAAGHDESKVYAIDYKTGFKQVSPAKSNWQLRLGALATARLHGASKAWVAIVYTKGKLYTDWAEFDSIDLDSFADQLKDAYKAWTSAKPRFTTGAHCGYCPAISQCPAQAGLWKTLTGKADNLDPVELYELFRAGQAQLKALESTLRAVATQQPIELGDGRLYGIAKDGKLKEFRR